ncbi:hypothetical protein BH10PSE19_BH10PSE19_03210 [soil metagenome]
MSFDQTDHKTTPAFPASTADSPSSSSSSPLPIPAKRTSPDQKERSSGGPYSTPLPRRRLHSSPFVSGSDADSSIFPSFSRQHSIGSPPSSVHSPHSHPLHIDVTASPSGSHTPLTSPRAPWTPTPSTPQLRRPVGTPLSSTSQRFVEVLTQTYLAEAKTTRDNLIAFTTTPALLVNATCIQNFSLNLFRCMGALREHARITETFFPENADAKIISPPRTKILMGDVKDEIEGYANDEFIKAQKNFQQTFYAAVQSRRSDIFNACLKDKFFATIATKKFEKIWHHFIKVYTQTNGWPRPEALAVAVGITEMDADIADKIANEFNKIRNRHWSQIKVLLAKEYPGIHPSTVIQNLLQIRPIVPSKLEQRMRGNFNLLLAPSVLATLPPFLNQPIFSDFQQLLNAISHDQIPLTAWHAAGFTEPQKLIAQCKILSQHFKTILPPSERKEEASILPNDPRFLPCLQALVNEPEQLDIPIAAPRHQAFHFLGFSSRPSFDDVSSPAVPPSTATEQLRIWQQDYAAKSKQHLALLIAQSKCNTRGAPTADELYLFTTHIFDLLSCLSYYYLVTLKLTSTAEQKDRAQDITDPMLVNSKLSIGVFELFQELAPEDQNALAEYLNKPTMEHFTSTHLDEKSIGLRYGGFREQFSSIKTAIRKSIIVNFVLRNFPQASARERSYFINMLLDLHGAVRVYSLLRNTVPAWVNTYIKASRIAKIFPANRAPLIQDFEQTFPQLVALGLSEEKMQEDTAEYRAFILRHLTLPTSETQCFVTMMGSEIGMTRLHALLKGNRAWSAIITRAQEKRVVELYDKHIATTSQQQVMLSDFEKTFANFIRQQHTPETKAASSAGGASSSSSLFSTALSEYDLRLQEDTKTGGDELLAKFSVDYEALTNTPLSQTKDKHLEEKNAGAFWKLTRTPFIPIPTPSHLPIRFSHWSSLAEAIQAYPKKPTLAALLSAPLPQKLTMSSVSATDQTASSSSHPRSTISITETHTDTQSSPGPKDIVVQIHHDPEFNPSFQTYTPKNSSKIEQTWQQRYRYTLIALGIALIVFLSTLPPVNATLLSFILAKGLIKMAIDTVCCLAFFFTAGRFIDHSKKTQGFIERNPITFGLFLIGLIVGSIPSITASPVLAFINLPWEWLTGVAKVLFSGAVFGITGRFINKVWNYCFSPSPQLTYASHSAHSPKVTSAPPAAATHLDPNQELAEIMRLLTTQDAQDLEQAKAKLQLLQPSLDNNDGEEKGIPAQPSAVMRIGQLEIVRHLIAQGEVYRLLRTHHLVEAQLEFEKLTTQRGYLDRVETSDLLNTRHQHLLRVFNPQPTLRSGVTSEADARITAEIGAAPPRSLAATSASVPSSAPVLV